MIRSLEDVERYSREHARLFPTVAREIELRRPGLNDLEATQLRRALPGLPDDYLEIAQRWDLAPVSIGYFNLSPPPFTRRFGMTDRLVAANGQPNPHFETLTSFGVLEVASYEGDPLVLGRKNSPRAGHVFRLAPSVDVPLRLRFVASLFADLLKAATELDSFRAAAKFSESDIDTFLQVIAQYMPDLTLGEWRVFAVEALQAP